MKSVLVTVIFVSLLHGCISKSPQGDIDLLSFLADGKNQRTEIRLRLGEPSAVFQDERILTYRLGGNKKRRILHMSEASRLGAGKLQPGFGAG